MQPDLTVSFEVKSGPARGRAGAARLVRRELGAPEDAAPEAGGTDAAPAAPAEQPGEIGGPDPRLDEEALAPADPEEGRS